MLLALRKQVGGQAFHRIRCLKLLDGLKKHIDALVVKTRSRWGTSVSRRWSSIFGDGGEGHRHRGATRGCKEHERAGHSAASVARLEGMARQVSSFRVEVRAAVKHFARLSA